MLSEINIDRPNRVAVGDHRSPWPRPVKRGRLNDGVFRVTRLDVAHRNCGRRDPMS
jgi:hypothetical protein